MVIYLRNHVIRKKVCLDRGLNPGLQVENQVCYPLDQLHIHKILSKFEVYIFKMLVLKSVYTLFFPKILGLNVANL